MAKQILGLAGSFGFDGAPATPVLANQIVIASTANAGNAGLSTAKALGFIGVTNENTDAQGYAAVQYNGVAQIVVGATPVVAGNQITSDANGNAVPVVPAGAGAATQVVGVALTSAAAGALVDVLIQPAICLS